MESYALCQSKYLPVDKMTWCLTPHTGNIKILECSQSDLIEKTKAVLRKGNRSQLSVLVRFINIGTKSSLVIQNWRLFPSPPPEKCK